MSSKVLTKRRIKRRLVSKKAKRKVRTMRKHRPLSNKLMRMSQRGGGLKVKKMMVCYKEEVEYYQSENPKSPMKKLFRLIPICTIFFVPRTFKKDDIYLFFDSEARDTRKKIIKGVNDHDDDDDDWENVDAVKKTAEMNKIIQLLLGIPDNTNFTLTPPIATTHGTSFKVPDPFNLGENIDGPILENTYVLLSTSILNTNYCVYTGFVWYRNRSDESSLYFKDDLKMLTKHDIIYSEKKLDIRKTASDIQTVILALEGKIVSGLEDTPLTVLEEIKETNANISAYSEVAYSYLYQRRIQRDMNNS